MQEGRHKKTSLELHLPLTLLQGFERLACERMLETEHKLHILTPLLWPSRCVLFSWCWGPLHRGFPRAPSVGCGLPLPHLVSTVWNYTGNCFGTQTQLSWIITQRPHDRPLDLWNRMFNRHQAEITVMQFRGYSLPVHDFNGRMGPSPFPIS